MLFLFGACCKWGRQLYTIAAPAWCVPPSYFHLSATLQTNLRSAVFRIFITFLRFSLTHLRVFFTFSLQGSGLSLCSCYGKHNCTSLLVILLHHTELRGGGGVKTTGKIRHIEIKGNILIYVSRVT
jgi:hypothetical protein